MGEHLLNYILELEPGLLEARLHLQAHNHGQLQLLLPVWTG